MSHLSSPLPVKLFVGMLARQRELFSSAVDALARLYGPIDFHSNPSPWCHTDYYTHEMGKDLLRIFVFFGRPIDPGSLPEVKRITEMLEREHADATSSGYQRRINLDPGYITESKVVLATAKDFPHRVYIGQGVYAEATLHYNKACRGFVPLQHTYPDFRADDVLRWFNDARERLRKALEKGARIR
jgi:hypothetical protein